MLSSSRNARHSTKCYTFDALYPSVGIRDFELFFVVLGLIVVFSAEVNAFVALAAEGMASIDAAMPDCKVSIGA